LTEVADLREVVGDSDYCVHLAALAHEPNGVRSVGEYRLANTVVTERLARAMADSRSARRMIYISSIGAVCSRSMSVVTEVTANSPETAYGQSKMAAEAAVKEALQ